MQQRMHLQQVGATLVGHGPWTLKLGHRLAPEQCDLEPMISCQDACAAQIHLLPEKVPRTTDLGLSKADLAPWALRAPWISDQL